MKRSICVVKALRLLGDICREAERHVDYRAEYATVAVFDFDKAKRRPVYRYIELRKNIRPPIDEHSSLASTGSYRPF
jgi:hypothetical protein